MQTRLEKQNIMHSQNVIPQHQGLELLLFPTDNLSDRFLLHMLKKSSTKSIVWKEW